VLITRYQVHVDDYRYGVYKSLCGAAVNGDITIGSHLAPEGPTLAGFKVGNQNHEGILTKDQSARIHSCEKGTGCKCETAGNKTVLILPIITRDGDQEIRETGIGGGWGDLTHRPELHIEDEASIGKLLAL
jgi:DNA cross-link repair 1C protein